MTSIGGFMATGYRFYPTEEELLGFYLHNKLQNSREDMEQVIPVADVYCFDPWELPPMSGVACREDGEQWFFFCPRQEREVHGGRPTRTTPSGYWKATGSPSLVFSSMNRAMGVKKTMVFYRGRAPTGTKTKWKMNEYRIFEVDVAAGGAAAITFSVASKTRREFSLCRMYTRSGCIRSFDRRPLDAPVSDDAGSPFATPPPAAGSIKRSRTEDESASSAGSGGDAASWRSVRQREDNNNKDKNDNFQLSLPEEDDYLEFLDNWL